MLFVPFDDEPFDQEENEKNFPPDKLSEEDQSSSTEELSSSEEAQQNSSFSEEEFCWNISSDEEGLNNIDFTDDESDLTESETEKLSNKETIVDLILEGKNICICGPGGTGKSYTLREVAFDLIARGKNVAVTATTGTAALNLKDGSALETSTLHRWAGIYNGEDHQSRLVQNINRKKMSRDKWRDTDVLFVDEVSMFGSELFSKLDYIGKAVRNNYTEPFGGLIVVFCGDFLQLPPVGGSWIFESSCWDKMEFNFIKFDQPKRYTTTDYFDFLNRIRVGSPTVQDIQKIKKRLDVYRKIKKEGISKDKIKPTIIYSKKVDVGAFNTDELNKLSGTPKTYYARDTIEGVKNEEGRTETVSSADKKSFSKLLEEAIPEVITLKIGAQVMLKINLDPSASLVNGSRGIVTDLGDRTVTVKFNSGVELELEPYMWDSGTNKVIATRSQIPLILAWSITTHKSQGSTVDNAIIDLGPSVFAGGQAYVALSRVKNFEGLFVSNFVPSSIKADKKVLEFMEKNNLL
ncbi:AAA family ATPase [bacterium]|nr:AAA family ATPase [bacterium]